MKTSTSIISLLLFCIIFACQEKENKEAIFTLVQSRIMYHYSGGGEYTNYILIENTPNDKEELKRLMIHHFLDLTSTIDTLQAHPGLTFSSCMFLKSTSATKRRFSLKEEDERGMDTYVGPGGRNSFGWYNNKTYVGEIYIRPAIDTLQAHSGLTFSSYMLLKSTSATKRRCSLKEEDERGMDTYWFWWKKFVWSVQQQTYVDKIYISRRCKDDKMKLIVSMDVSLGTASYDRFIDRGPDKETYILLNECDSGWYESNKEIELVKYFMEQKTQRE